MFAWRYHFHGDLGAEDLRGRASPIYNDEGQKPIEITQTYSE